MNRASVLILLPVLLLGIPPLTAAEPLPNPAPAAPANPAAPASSASPAAPVPLSPRFKQVRERISALYQNRNETPPPPDPRYNPFRPPGVAIQAAPVLPASAEPAAGEPVLVASATDLARLQEAVATLKVSGTFEKDGRLYLVINAKPYKDNDVIQTQVQGEPVYMRVRQVSRRSVTVVLNEAEMTLKF